MNICIVVLGIFLCLKKFLTRVLKFSHNYEAIIGESKEKFEMKEVLPHVTLCVYPYDEIYKSGDFFRLENTNLGQILMVDSGCPRSLMGLKEYEKLKKSYILSEEGVSSENFKFGPSRLYKSRFKVKLPVYFEECTMENFL